MALDKKPIYEDKNGMHCTYSLGCSVPKAIERNPDVLPLMDIVDDLRDIIEEKVPRPSFA